MAFAGELARLRFNPERPPVVLLGGLNVLRALGLGGIPVIVASDGDEVAFVSRYCRGRLVLPALENRRAVVDVLLDAGDRLARRLGRRPPLFYSNDNWQRLVQDYRAELAQHYTLLLNDPDVADAVIDKERFQSLAAARELPIPRTLTWQELAHVCSPVLIKPRAKYAHAMSAAQLRVFGRQSKARIFRDGKQLFANAAAEQIRDELVIQEYVAGDDGDIWSFHGFSDEHSQVLDWFIGRKIRTYPALTGTSTYLELSRNEELAELGHRAVARLGLKGVFKIDLKRDVHSARFRILEVNARYNLWHYLGAANGLNLPLVAYEYIVHGRRPAARRPYRTTHRWLYLRFDWLAYRQLAARGELTFRAWVASLLAAPKVYQLFRWDDPLPFLYRLRRLGARLPHLTSAMRRWLSTAS